MVYENIKSIFHLFRNTQSLYFPKSIACRYKAYILDLYLLLFTKLKHLNALEVIISKSKQMSESLVLVFLVHLILLSNKSFFKFHSQYNTLTQHTLNILVSANSYIKERKYTNHLALMKYFDGRKLHW